MTSPEYQSVMHRIDAIGVENREDVRALTKELALTRESLLSCQGRCWVMNQSRAMVAPWVSALAACAALFLSAIALLR